MAQPVTPIPIEHHPMTHEVATTYGSDSRAVTLFDLVAVVSEVTDDENDPLNQVIVFETLLLHLKKLRSI